VFHKVGLSLTTNIVRIAVVNNPKAISKLNFPNTDPFIELVEEKRIAKD